MEKINSLNLEKEKIQKQEIENFIKASKKINQEGKLKVPQKEVSKIIDLINSQNINKNFLEIFKNEENIQSILVALAGGLVKTEGIITAEDLKEFNDFINKIYNSLEKYDLTENLNNFQFILAVINYLYSFKNGKPNFNLYFKTKKGEKLTTKIVTGIEENFIIPYFKAVKENPTFFSKLNSNNQLSLLSQLLARGGDIKYLNKLIKLVYPTDFENEYDLASFIDNLGPYLENIDFLSKKEQLKKQYKDINFSKYDIDINEYLLKNSNNLSLNDLISIKLIVNNDINLIKKAYEENFQDYIKELGKKLNIKELKTPEQIIKTIQQLNNYYEYEDEESINPEKIENIIQTNKFGKIIIDKVLNSNNSLYELQQLSKKNNINPQNIGIFLHNFITEKTKGNIGFFNIKDYSDFIRVLEISKTEENELFSFIYLIEKNYPNLEPNKILKIINTIYFLHTYGNDTKINNKVSIDIKKYEKFKQKQEETEAKLIIANINKSEQNLLDLVDKIYLELKDKLNTNLLKEIYIGTEKVSITEQLNKFFTKKNIEQILSQISSGNTNLYKIIEKTANDYNLFSFLKKQEDKKLLIETLIKFIKKTIEDKKLDNTIDLFSENKKFINLIENIATNLTTNKIEKNIYKNSLTYLIGNLFFEEKNNFKKGNKYIFDKNFIHQNKEKIRNLLEKKLFKQDKEKTDIVINNLLQFNGKIEFTEEIFKKLNQNKKALEELEKIQKLGINKYLEQKEQEENEKKLVESNGGVLKTEHNIQDSIFANENISPSKIYTKYEEKGGLHYIHLKLPGKEKVFTIAALKNIDANKEAINTYLSNMFDFNIRLNGNADLLNKIISNNTNVAKEGINTEDLNETTKFIQILVYHNFHLNGGKKEKEFLKKHNLNNPYELFSNPEKYTKHFSQAIKTESSIGGFQTNFQGFEINLETINSNLFDKNYQKEIKEKILSRGNNPENIGEKIFSLWNKLTDTFKFS